MRVLQKQLGAKTVAEAAEQWLEQNAGTGGESGSVSDEQDEIE
jgi:hypothetical protein